jgi:hypothetical protein
MAHEHIEDEWPSGFCPMCHSYGVAYEVKSERLVCSWSGRAAYKVLTEWLIGNGVLTRCIRRHLILHTSTYLVVRVTII